MNGLKTGLGITPGEHIISADSALSRNIRHCFCLSCHGRLILQTDAQGAWFEHDLHALSEQQKADCVVLNPEKSHPYIEDMAMFLSPLPVVLEWHCVMCEQFFHGKKFCEACGTGIYCRAVCTKSVYRYQPASTGSTGDSYDNAMAESINGLYKAEVIHRKSWKNRAEVELATLTWVDWYNNRRLLGRLGHTPPAEAEKAYYASIGNDDLAA